jgi:ABC-type glycerol-3-phosphate transport system substrate-binding protein
MKYLPFTFMLVGALMVAACGGKQEQAANEDEIVVEFTIEEEDELADSFNEAIQETVGEIEQKVDSLESEVDELLKDI